MKEIIQEPRVGLSMYVPKRVKTALSGWAENHLSDKDHRATPGDAAAAAIDALTQIKWKPGMKLKTLR